MTEALIVYAFVGLTSGMLAFAFDAFDVRYTYEAQMTGSVLIGLAWPIALACFFVWLSVQFASILLIGARDLYTVYAGRRAARRSKFNIPTNAPLPVARILRK